MKSTIIIATLFAAVLGAPVAPPQGRQAGSNFQTFTAALGGIAATPVVDSGIANRKFQVKNDTFVNIGAALQRSCDQQFNACANAANGGSAAFKVADCSAQKDQCDATAPASTTAAQGNANGNANGNAQQANSGNAQSGNQAAACQKKQ